MKENELRKHSVCSRCGKKIGHTGLPLFWTVSATRYGIDFSALKRSAGLAMMLGSAELAEVMGPNEDMAEQVQQVDITLCEECAFPIIELIEFCEVESKTQKLPRSES